MTVTPIALHTFITDNQVELIARARVRVLQRKAPRATPFELERGVPLFLTQLAALLRASSASTDGNKSSAQLQMEQDAGAHGKDLFISGLTIAQVVNDYGDVCQVITELALERDVPIGAAEFRAFNRCLDDAIARAVTDYSAARECSIADEGTQRLAVLAHEMLNLLSTATLSFDMIKRGVVGTDSSVSAMHARSLSALSALVDRSLTEVRLESRSLKREHLSVAAFIEEAEIGASIQARAHGLGLVVYPVEAKVAFEIDRQMMSGALVNLLQNAFRLTRPEGVVTLKTRETEERVYIEVEDQCGGLPAGMLEKLTRPLEPNPQSLSARKLGLALARRAIAANGGELTVLDLPKLGCRFTIDLPRSNR